MNHTHVNTKAVHTRMHGISRRRFRVPDPRKVHDLFGK